MPEPFPPTLLADLLKIFTVEQLEMFRDECDEMRLHGFGSLVITFENHHPQITEQRRSRQFPKPTNYKPE